MENEKVKVHVPVLNLQKTLEESKELLTRLNNGKNFIDQSLKKGNVLEATSGVRLYNKLAEDLYNTLEKASFIHEFLTTGRSVVINRDGIPIKTQDVVSDIDVYKLMTPYKLKSVAALKEVFGDEYISILEFKD